ncbi:NAD(P)-dependent oxidoreductase, partial [Streptomyces sp. NPDC057757]
MSASRKIAFVGLGIMGKPMAVNLVKAGHHVTGFDLSPASIDTVIAAGGHGAASIADAVKDAEVVITMVPADPHVEAVILGEGGVLENVQAGTLVIDMSSITPQTSIKVGKAAREKGVRTLDAPVSGGEAGAVEAVLSIMVGGEAADFAEAKPLFDALGTT